MEPKYTTSKEFIKSKREYYLPFLEKLIDHHKAWVEFLSKNDPEILDYLCGEIGKPYTVHYEGIDEPKEITLPMSLN